MGRHGFTAKKVKTENDVTEEEAVRRRERDFKEVRVLKLTISRQVINNFNFHSFFFHQTVVVSSIIHLHTAVCSAQCHYNKVIIIIYYKYF